MRIEPLILTLVAALTSGCPTTWDCDPPSEHFFVQTTLNEGELTRLMQDWGFENRTSIECDTACQYTYGRERSWNTTKIRACTLIVSDPPGATPESLGAMIKCSGDGIEFFCEGRRPIGHIDYATIENSLGAYFARCAYLEAASVTAFVELAARLRDMDAPHSLQLRCLCAAQDESRHAEQIGKLAHFYGVEPPLPRHHAQTPDLLALALDNAVEGCIHEAWAALQAAWRAHAAAEPELRAIYAAIAKDEASHAQIAWDLHEWFMQQLDANDRDVVRQAQATALAHLPELAAKQAADTLAILGKVNSRAMAKTAAQFAACLREAG